MAVDLGDYVPALRREVTPPGSTVFATVPDSVLEGYLADAFWEARLDGFMKDFTVSPTAVVTRVDGGTDDIPRELIALIILYAGLKILRNQLINTQTAVRTKAGPVSFETERSANLMTEMAKQLAVVRTRLLNTEFEMTPTMLIDAFSVRQMPSAGGFGQEYLEWVGSTFAELVAGG